MSPFSRNLSSDALKALECDIMEFTVEEGGTLSKPSSEYLKITREAIKRTLTRMPVGGSVSFVFPESGKGMESALQWLEGWKDRTGRNANQQEDSLPRKRARDGTLPEPVAKRSKAATDLRLLHFHVTLLLDLLQGNSNVEDAVLLLQDSLTIVNAGAKSRIALWHLNRVKCMVPVPDNEEISDAVDMLSECISYMDKL